MEETIRAVHDFRRKRGSCNRVLEKEVKELFHLSRGRAMGGGGGGGGGIPPRDQTKGQTCFRSQSKPTTPIVRRPGQNQKNFVVAIRSGGDRVGRGEQNQGYLSFANPVTLLCSWLSGDQKLMGDLHGRADE